MGSYRIDSKVISDNILNTFACIDIAFLLGLTQSSQQIRKKANIMEDELNYLRSEIAKIRMEKERTRRITHKGKAIGKRELKKLSQSGDKKDQSKFLKDIEQKKSASIAKNKRLYKTKPIYTKTKNSNSLPVKANKYKTNVGEEKNKNQKRDKAIFGVLELFELDKESVLLYHLCMLENKI